MLSEAQIEAASEAELLETVRAISSRLDGFDVEAVLRAARDTLAAYGVAGGVRIIVAVDEWDDGYFYSGVDHVENEQGIEVALSPSVIAALVAALEQPLTELSRNGAALGRFAACTIDIGAWTVSR